MILIDPRLIFSKKKEIIDQTQVPLESVRSNYSIKHLSELSFNFITDVVINEYILKGTQDFI